MIKIQDPLFRLRALPHARHVVLFIAEAVPGGGLDWTISPAEARRLAVELQTAASEAEAFAATIADPRTSIALAALRDERAYIARRITALEEAEEIISSRIKTGP